MENQNKHTQNATDLEDVLSQFSDEERASVKDVWQQSKKADHRMDIVSENEVEEALENVHFRIEQENRTHNKGSNISGFIVSNTRYLVAAVALIVLGFGFLFVPKTVTVPNAEMAVIDLPDGSTVELNSGSTLQYNRLFAFTNRDLTLNGEAYFSVETAEDPFILEANGSATEVTGTEFNVRSWADDPTNETTVTVTEGHVEFYPAGKKSNRVSLTAGQTSRLNAEMNSPAQPITSSEEHLAWRENRMVFQQTPLIVILKNLERSFDVEIELDVEGMDDETLTAYYNQPTNIETILEDICTVKGLRYTATNNGYRIFK
jgi:ferric-dicitrate binding protein FerR (iron transport regulator)